MKKRNLSSNIAELYSKATGTEYILKGGQDAPTDEQINMLKAALAYRLNVDQYYAIVTHFGLEDGLKVDVGNIVLQGKDPWEVYCAAMNALGRNPLPSFPIVSIGADSDHSLGPDESVKRLGLSNRVINGLLRCEIMTIGDLLRAERNEKLFSCRNFGEKSRDEVEAAMANAGYKNFTLL